MEPQFRTRVFLGRFKTTDAENATHLALNGGKWIIPSQYRAEFYECLVRDRAGEVPFFFTEKHGLIFPFYLDLDYSATEMLTEAQILAMVCLVQKAVHEFYLTLSQWSSRGAVIALVCGEPTPVVTAQKRNFLKTGVHLVMPSLFVDQEQAVALANHITQVFMREMPHTADMAPWPAIVDLGVYGRGGGLRMMGSSKCDRCTTCARKGPAARNTCTDCSGNGQRISGAGRIYAPLMYVYGDALVPDRQMTTRLRNDLRFAWDMATILCDQAKPTIGFQYPADFVPLDKKQVTGINRYANNEICPSDPRARGIQEWIQSARPQWSKLTVTKLTSGRHRAGANLAARPAPATYLAHVIGTGATWCLNAGRAHTSSTIYFTITIKGLAQRCFSKKTASEVGVTACSDYTSPRIPIYSLHLIQLLFPDMAQVGADIQSRYADVMGTQWAGGRDKVALTRRQIIKMHFNAVIPEPKFLEGPVKRERPHPPILERFLDYLSKEPSAGQRSRTMDNFLLYFFDWSTTHWKSLAAEEQGQVVRFQNCWSDTALIDPVGLEALLEAPIIRRILDDMEHGPPEAKRPRATSPSYL